MEVAFKQVDTSFFILQTALNVTALLHEETGQKLFFIDQLNKAMIESGNWKEGDNHCTLMLAEEY